MITAEVVFKRDSSYRSVCAVAERIYNETIKVSPTSFPPIFIALFEDGVPVGSVGLYIGTNDNLFLTEEYCVAAGFNARFLVPHDAKRNQLGEVCCFNLDAAYRKDYFTLLFSLMYEFAYFLGIKHVFLIQALTLRRTFRQTGINPRAICEPDLKNYDGNQAEKEKWQQVYFSKLQPVCSVIDMKNNAGNYFEKKALNETVFPKVEIGPQLLSIFENGEAMPQAA